MTLNAIQNDPLPNGRIRVGFVDPWTGQNEWGEIDVSSGRIENMGGSGGGGGALIGMTMIVCPREPMVAWGPGPMVYHGPINAPPAATPIGIPNFAGRYFVHVIVVNTSGHAHRQIGIVDYRPTSRTSEDEQTLPLAFSLGTVMPNPFAAETQITFAVPQHTALTLTVFDVEGRSVRRLVDGEVEAGMHQVQWDGLDDLGRHVPAGIYYASMQAGTLEETRQITLLR
jgi:hypothetical protein